MYLIQLLYKSLDWAIGTDDGMIKKAGAGMAVKNEETKVLFVKLF